MNYADEIGSPPWTYEEMRESYYEFKSIYAARPIEDNIGGMKAPHAFGAWFMLKKLQPNLIIESGVWKGQGTWLIEQACPKSEIICLDVSFKNLIFRSEKAEYIEKDFSLVDFSNADLKNSVCFFDDHQNALMRLQQMKWKGFERAIFEDNYPSTRGDCYSIKKMLADSGFKVESKPESSREKPLSKKFSWRALRVIGKAAVTDKSKDPAETYIVPPNATHKVELRRNLKTYFEVPPIFKSERTRWGDKWESPQYPTKEPLFDQSVMDELRNEEKHYTWMCYIELA